MGDDMPMPARGGYSIDWDAIDLGAMDPFATKTKVTNNFDTGSANPPMVRQDSDVDVGIKTGGLPASPDENKEPTKTSNRKPSTKPKTTASGNAAANKKPKAVRVPMRERLAAIRAKKSAEKTLDSPTDDSTSCAQEPSAQHHQSATEPAKKPAAQPVSLQEKIAEMRRKKKQDAHTTQRQAAEAAAVSDGGGGSSSAHAVDAAAVAARLGPASDSRMSSVERPASEITLPDSDACSVAVRSRKSSTLMGVVGGGGSIVGTSNLVHDPRTPPKGDDGVGCGDASQFQTPGLKESELVSQMDDMSLVRDDAPTLLQDAVTPTTNSLRGHSHLDHHGSSPPLAQKVLSLNAAKAHQTASSSFSSSQAAASHPSSPALDSELLNMLVALTAAKQMDNEIYSNLKVREKEMSEQSTQDASERAEIEEYYTQLKTRYDRLKSTHNNSNRRRQHTSIESEIQRQKELNFSKLKANADSKQQFEEFKVGVTYKMSQYQQELTLSKSREKMLSQKVKALTDQVNGLQEQNEGLEKICEEMLEAN